MLLTRNYDPDEARDERGRWTVGAGGAPDHVDKMPPGFVAFHGTTDSLLASIMKHGLTAGKGKGADEWAKQNGVQSFEHAKAKIGGRRASVYITQDPVNATFFANYATRVSGGRPVVLEVELPHSWVMQHRAKLYRDEKSDSQDDFRFEGTIPAKFIKHAHFDVPRLSDAELSGGVKANEQVHKFYVVLVADGAPTSNVKRPVRTDPSRTGHLRRQMVAELNRRFSRFKGALHKYLVVTANEFCPTGPGGGVDPTCSPHSGSPTVTYTPMTEEAWHNLDIQTPIAEAHKLAGVTDPDAKVQVVNAGNRAIYIHVNAPKYSCIRKIYHDSNGDNVIWNQEFTVKPEFRRKGVGAHVFADEVKNAAAAGFKYIETFAAGHSYDAHYNGYYTWARLGYDAPLNTALLAYGKAEEAEHRFGATTVQGVMKTEEGRKWWKENGGDFKGKFDLAPGSRSMQILDAYLRAKSRTSAMTTNAPSTKLGASSTVSNEFCPTGPGGGVDPTCSPNLPAGFKPQGNDPRNPNGPNPAVPSSFRPQLTLQEANAVAHYTGDKFRKEVNAALWKGQQPPTSWVDRQLRGTDAKQVHEGLQSAFAKLKDGPSATLQRAITVDDIGAFERYYSGNKDAVLSGYQSTSARSDGKSQYSGNLKYTIHATRGLDVGPYTKYPGEHEVLLNADEHYRVDSVKRVGNELHVELTQLPKPTHNAFCPTGPGGGVDDSCSPGSGIGVTAGDEREHIWIKDSPTANYSFTSDPDKLQAFQAWLRTQIRGNLTDEQMWNRYVQAGFRKGAARAYDDVKSKTPKTEPPDFYRGSRDQFLETSFNQPETADKVKLLASRAYSDMGGITDAMAARMTRVLTDGLVQGKNPREIGSDLVDEVDMAKSKAVTVARTELIRAHAEGQLDAMEDLGVPAVGVDVEFLTAGDANVCDECASLEGSTYSVDDAHGVIPVHPNCRCCFVPALDAPGGGDVSDAH